MPNPDNEPQTSQENRQPIPVKHDSFLEEFKRRSGLMVFRIQAQSQARETAAERKQVELAVIKEAMREDLTAGFTPRERTDDA